MTKGTVRCLITAGPTREYLDPVRFISNPSTGTMGFAIAQAAVAAGWSVDLVAGPVALHEPDGVILYPVETGEEMFAQVDALFDACDVLIMTAAVCDFRPVHCSKRKVSKQEASLTVEFEPVVDILKTVAARKAPHQLVMGFAAETHDLETHALDKLQAKNADWIAANQIGARDSGFGSGKNTLSVFSRHSPPVTIGPASKADVARSLIDLIASHLTSR